MAYPGHHPGMGSMYAYGSNPSQYQRQNPLPPAQPLLIPQNPPQPVLSQQTYQHPSYNMPSATIGNTDPPQTPSQESEADDEANRNRPDIEPLSKQHNGLAYVLKVVQQPSRARMCGFGDKDRRPISPPPCIKLCIYDTSTTPAKEIDYREVLSGIAVQDLLIPNSQVEDLSRYVIMVDLACMETLQEKNLVTHPQASPSISTVTISAFPQTQTSASPSRGSGQNYPLSNLPEYSPNRYTYSSGVPNGNGQPGAYWGNGTGSNDYARQYPQHAFQSPNPYAGGYNQPNGSYATDQRGVINGNRGQGPSTLSRNLIGSLSGSAFKLRDLENRVGLWFCFQDLSVRTEGWFRLKFTFFDLKDSMNPQAGSGGPLSKYAPMLACAYSKPFKVFSAKKFPGVIESTPLSKRFAEQGIKIPIRKDGNRDGERSGQKRRRERHDEDGNDVSAGEDDEE